VILIKPSPTPYFFELHAPFSRTLNEAMKQLPGASNRKDDQTGNWRHVFGADLIGIVSDLVFAIFRQTAEIRLRRPVPKAEEVEGLRPYQVQYVTRALHLGGSAAFMEMGTGKTPPALTVARIIGGKLLVVTPPQVVYDFKQQIEPWLKRPLSEVWPSKKTIGPKDAPTEEHTVVVLSHARLHYILNNPAFSDWVTGKDGHGAVQTVIGDEAQAFCKHTSKCSKEIEKVLKLIPLSVRLPLTGTPMPDRPKDIFQAMHTFWPWCFGPFAINRLADDDKPVRANFRDRYLQCEHNGYGLDVVGLNERTTPELKARIAAMGVRVTEEEAAPYLPPFTLTRVEAEAPKGQALWNENDLNEQDMQAEMARLAEPKAEATIDRALSVLSDLRPHKYAIVVWHRKVAERVFEAIQKEGYPTHLIMGGMADFDQAVNNATNDREAVAVFTMASIKTGLNRLACFNRYLYGEMHYNPAMMAQSMARFRRSVPGAATRPVFGEVIFCPGTLDEKIWPSLTSKLHNIGKLLPLGGTETAIKELDGVDDDWQAAFRRGLE
jgi:hypothetical protein